MKPMMMATLLLLVSLFFWYCKPDDSSGPYNVGYDYFPYETGMWHHYDVDSTVWDDFTGETYYYESQILEIVESCFTVQEGNQALRIERYYRDSDTSQWVISDVWFANLKAATAEKVEENVRFIKLAFPVRMNNTWNGNAFNSLDSEEYEYEDIDEPFIIDGVTFDSTLMVIHSNSVNLIEEDIRYELYARHVGMIKKYTKTVSKNIAQPDQIVSGVLVEYKLRNYGF
jgi:hypothetical protein